MKNIAQTLFALTALGSIIAFASGVSSSTITWPGAVLAGFGLAALLGTSIAVKHLYFRDE